ncbi:MAG: sterol desaturase family protein [Microcoleaceae cyanobacterium]
MILLKTVLVTIFLLLSGDFIATFLYHVPEHIFGKFHTIVHHSPNRSFVRYALRTRKPCALITGFFGAFPYLMFTPFLWMVSPVGTILGLALAECHVEWRHISLETWKTPPRLERICRFFCITTPERHWQHHCNSRVAFGDIFTFYDQPAQEWFRFLLRIRKKLRASYG